MSIFKEVSGFTPKILTKSIAKLFAVDLARLASQIPLVKYTEHEILAENKGKRIFFGKWDHSLVLFDGPRPIGLIIGYERMSEDNDQYPENTLYISELAIDHNYRRKGLAKQLLERFFDMNKNIKYKYLNGKFNFSVQTNSADWNKHVQNLYLSFGFTKRTTKVYPDRVDYIYNWYP